MEKLSSLRKRHPLFTYKNYSWRFIKRDLHISFHFRVPPNIEFRPKVVIKNVSKKSLREIGKGVLSNFIFHLGMMEIPSYWKATCSPQIIVEAGNLNATQIAWWKNLFMQGLGEFFYQNKIDFTKPNFLRIISSTERVSRRSEVRVGRGFGGRSGGEHSLRVLVPVGGGKDSSVTLELLKKSYMKQRPFLLNPRKPQLALIAKAKVKAPIVALRTIDPRLLELNRKGYLNGHTPFSAYLAFLSVFVAVLFDYKYIALSNERSSNEGNVKYKGKVINHQYSKSFEFEKKFREYTKKYLAKDMEYFSFLRSLYELQIAKIFAGYSKYFGVFLSCNEARKTKSGKQKPTEKWCGKCAKCLFVYVILSPFVKQKTLEKIFRKNLLKDRSLAPLMEQLSGKRGFKPFECVGTPQEVAAAISLLNRAKDNKGASKILRSWNSRNFVPLELARILKNSLARPRIIGS